MSIRNDETNRPDADDTPPARVAGDTVAENGAVAATSDGDRDAHPTHADALAGGDANDADAPRDGDATPADTLQDGAAIDTDAPVDVGAAEHETVTDGEVYDDEPYIPARSVVTMGRGLFFSMVAFAVLALAALGASTAYLLLDRNRDDGTVVATVNGEKITRDEYDRAVAAGSGQQVIDQLILERLVDAEAKKRGLIVDEQQVTKVLDEQRGAFSSPAEYESALKEAGLTEEDLIKRIRLREALKLMVAEQSRVTDEEIAQRYEQTKSQYPGLTLELVREQIRTTMEQEKSDQAIPALLEQLKAGAEIETNLPGAVS